jgi:type II secretory pathway pseudopilin PulG
MGLLSLFAILFPFLLILAVLFSLRYLRWPEPDRRVLLLAWGSALLLPLGMLFLPRYTLVPDHTNPFFFDPYYSIYASTRYLLPPLAWILASLLLSFGLAGVQSQPTAPGVWRAIASLALGAILLMYSVYDLYWLFVWDQTGDAVYVALLPVPITAACYAGLIFTRPHEGSRMWYGVGYAVLLVAAIFTAFSISIRVDHQRLTEARAGQVSQAIERYYGRKGHYPATLAQLVPWTRLSLPKPVTMMGQDWCYQSGEGYYRLGYVSRDNWSSPELLVRTHQQAGAIPDITALCAGETQAIMARSRVFSVVEE